MDREEKLAIEQFLITQGEENSATIYELVHRAIGSPEPGKIREWHSSRKQITEELEALIAQANWPENGDEMRNFGNEAEGLDIPAWHICRWVVLLEIKCDESCV